MGAVDHGGALQAFFETLAVECVAAGDLIMETLLFAAAGPFYGIGKQEEAKIGVGKNLRTDVAAFHHEAVEVVASGGVGLTALVVEQGRAHLGDRGEGGHMSGDLGAANLGIRDRVAGEFDLGVAAGDPGGDGDGGQGGLHAG